MYLMYLRFQAQGGWGAAKYRYDTSSARFFTLLHSHDVLLLAGAWSGWWRGVWHEEHCNGTLVDTVNYY